MKNLLRIVICDDEDFYIGDVSGLLSDYAAARPELTFTVLAYTSPFALLADLDNGKVGDIYLLDIYMDVMNGVELARSLRRALPECQIIFLTTSREHAVEAFEVGAAHYLEKPIFKEGFNTAMDRATAALIKRPVEQLVCQMGGGCIEIIPFSEIILA
ncbi:MAG: response regulator, partial [Cloacibacillus sp.]